MPSHSYEAVPSTDRDENISLVELADDMQTPYFSGNITSAPPSFHSRANSFSEMERTKRDRQPVPFGAVIPGAINNDTSETWNSSSTVNNDTSTTWTSSSTINQDEIIGRLVARIERLEAEALAKRNEDGDEEIGVGNRRGDAESLVPPRRNARNPDNCCNSLTTIIITVMTFCFLLGVFALFVEALKAWKNGFKQCEPNRLI